MRHKLLKIIRAVAGKHYSNFKHVIDYFYQVPQFRTQWLSFGPYFISLCPNYSITTSSFKNGFQKILNNTQWIKVNWININWRGYIWYYNHSCFEDWRRMLSKKLLPKLKRQFLVKCLTGRKYSMIELSARYPCRIYFNKSKLNKRWRIWWI